MEEVVLARMLKFGAYWTSLLNVKYDITLILSPSEKRITLDLKLAHRWRKCIVQGEKRGPISELDINQKYTELNFTWN